MKKEKMIDFITGISAFFGLIGIALFGYVCGQSLKDDVTIPIYKHALFMSSISLIIVGLSLFLLISYAKKAIKSKS